MFHKIGVYFFILAVTGTITVGYTIWKRTLPLVSPIALIEVFTQQTPTAKSNKIIYGFFPYWNLKYSEELYIHDLTHLAYFAVDLNPDGTINKVNTKKEQEPGWNKLHSKAVDKLFYQSKLLGQKTVLTVTAMDTDLIESILSPANMSTAINSILDVYSDKKFHDINIDFEYVGTPSQFVRNNFTAFITQLKQNCLKFNRQCHVDIDIFGDAAERTRLWDLPQLAAVVDRFIVMTYDYYRKNSPQAGPVAPITGKCTTTSKPSNDPCLEQDILTHISQMVKIIPANKILLGIPFYGYEWQTASRDYLANTYPGTGSLASYQRVQTIISNPLTASLSTSWSTVSLSPFLVFEKDNQIIQIQYENPASIAYKIKLVNSADLGGIAIWALGYEVPHTDIWQPIKALTGI